MVFCVWSQIIVNYFVILRGGEHQINDTFQLGSNQDSSIKTVFMFFLYGQMSVSRAASDQ